MLKTYFLSCKKKGDVKEYKLKFKEEKGVKVTFTQSGEDNIVDLQYDELASEENYDKNFTAKVTLRIKFHQQSATGTDKYRESRPPKPVPEIVIEP